MTRNKFEAQVAQQLGEGWHYEAAKLPYTITFTYTPDFINHETKTIVESKGFLRDEDRRKMIAVKKAHPDYTIHIIFQKPDTRISKSSKTTYKQWAEKNGFRTDWP